MSDYIDESEEAWREVGRLYHDYMIRWTSDQRDDGSCQIISDKGRGRVVGEEANTRLAKKLIDGEIEGRHPSDWQAGNVAGGEVGLQTGKPVTN
ncbi:hypothetical protein AB4Z51_03320 [Bradyrhizobium sp. 2TAF36]|uniref:hypothetical protein n=1 Tax=Bradyrhizobium sp. 2TAF36 TaxID=3233016 RepID=UPI003F938B39